VTQTLDVLIKGSPTGAGLMTVSDLIAKNRSYRRFFQDHAIDRKTLEDLVDLARISASAANLQPLKYFLSCDLETNALIFRHLAWAGYLKDWPGPEEGERPAAFILILGDKKIAKSIDCDHGIASQSMLLGAVEKGLGGCILASIKRRKLAQALEIPEHLEVLLALALGEPKETVMIDSLPGDGNIRYWRDAESVHHVPKRSLSDIIIN